MGQRVAWHFEKSGYFTVRSAYRLGVSLRDIDSNLGSSSSHPDGSRPVWKKFWSLPIPHKVRIFAWKLIHGGLATKANKFRRKLEPTATCSICGSGEETEFHAVMCCPHAKSLRYAMRSCWPIPGEKELGLTGPEWLLNVINTSDPDAAAQLILILWRHGSSATNGSMKAGGSTEKPQPNSFQAIGIPCPLSGKERRMTQRANDRWWTPLSGQLRGSQRLVAPGRSQLQDG